MAILTKSISKYQSDQTNTGTTIITTGTKINGAIELDCNFFVDGFVEGNIQSSYAITVGKNGTIKGDIVAKKLIVNGIVEGNIEVEEVLIKPKGIVKGTLSATVFVIEPEGFFEGQSQKKQTTPLLEQTNTTEEQNEK